MATRAKEDVQSQLESSWKALQANAYPRYLAFLAARKLAQWVQAKQGAEAAIPYFQSAARQLGRAAADPRFGSGNQRIFVQGILRTWGSSGILKPAEMMMQEMEKVEDLDPWVGQVLAGYALVDTGFQVRGSKWAREVPEEAASKMSEHLSHAEQVLLAAHQLHPEYPEAATKMITVRMAISTGDSGEDLGRLRKWFDAAVAAQMDYKPAYGQMLWALRPRWGGSHEHMLSLGRECLETGRFDTGVPILFWQAIQDVASETKDLPALLRRKGVTQLVDRLVTGLSRESQWSPMMSYWRSLQILVHYSAGQRERAHALFKQFGSTFVEQAFEQVPGLDSKSVLKDLRSATR